VRRAITLIVIAALGMYVMQLTLVNALSLRVATVDPAGKAASYSLAISVSSLPRSALDLNLEVRWNGHLVSRPPAAALYWTSAEILAHTTINRAAVRPGDLLASDTVSGPRPGSWVPSWS
jgi:2-keto-4-pentenoate hydratase/2-oxohepta-3-ene-1,7-dioic acid hydratase in catechol pathway